LSVTRSASSIAPSPASALSNVASSSVRATVNQRGHRREYEANTPT
jgi:hypothetical protein